MRVRVTGYLDNYEHYNTILYDDVVESVQYNESIGFFVIVCEDRRVMISAKNVIAITEEN